MTPERGGGGVGESEEGIVWIYSFHFLTGIRTAWFTVVVMVRQVLEFHACRAVYSLHCIPYRAVFPTLYSLQSRVPYTVFLTGPCIPYTVFLTGPCSLHCIPYRTVYSLHCIPYRTVYSLHCIPYRAVYSDASIFILDDPFSAVDGQVGNYIFEK